MTQISMYWIFPVMVRQHDLERLPLIYSLVTVWQCLISSWVSDKVAGMTIFFYHGSENNQGDDPLGFIVYPKRLAHL